MQVLQGPPTHLVNATAVHIMTTSSGLGQNRDSTGNAMHEAPRNATLCYAGATARAAAMLAPPPLPRIGHVRSFSGEGMAVRPELSVRAAPRMPLQPLHCQAE